MDTKRVYKNELGGRVRITGEFGVMIVHETCSCGKIVGTCVLL